MRQIIKFAAFATLLFLVAPLGQASVFRYTADLTPEVPGATGSGFVTVDYNSSAHTLFLKAEWAGLSGLTTVAHIHCCVASPGTVGVAVTPVTLPGFPEDTAAGTYTSPVLDLTAMATFTAGFVTNFAGGILADAEEALIAGFNNELAYFNIHSSAFPGGEIRGFLAFQQTIPEPGSIALICLGLAGLGFIARRKT